VAVLAGAVGAARHHLAVAHLGDQRVHDPAPVVRQRFAADGLPLVEVGGGQGALGGGLLRERRRGGEHRREEDDRSFHGKSGA
jgi:hypothetical protein